MEKIFLLCLTILLIGSLARSQSEAYQNQKVKKIEKGSVFTKIIDRELPATIVYEDKDIIAFVPLQLQAPVHLLIVPKKEIQTINDATDENAGQSVFHIYAFTMRENNRAYGDTSRLTENNININ